MKVFVTLRCAGGLEPVNLQITADGTATVGDVAQAIASCPESGARPQIGEQFTLRRYDDLYGSGRELSPRLALLSSGITSGAYIELTSPTEAADSSQAVAMLRVLEGPDRGIEVPLHRGSSVIGRGSDCVIRLSDPRASKRHAEILITDRVEVIDLNSANGVEMRGVRVGRTNLAQSDTFRVGDSLLQVHVAQDLAAAAANTDIVFTRSPRVISRPRHIEVKAPEVPAEPQPNPFPLLALLAPLIMGAVMYFVTQSLLSIIFVALSPVMMLGTWVSTRAAMKRRRRLDTVNFREALRALRENLQAGNDSQRQQLMDMFPSLDECLGAMGQLGPVIWSRRPEHPEFGQIRLGLGDVPSVQSVRLENSKGRLDLLPELLNVVADNRMVRRAPVISDLLQGGNLGVSGERDAAAMVARGLVLQLAVTHSPNEVYLSCLTSAGGETRWRWMEWLPHVNPTKSPLGASHLAADDANARRILDRLEDLIEARAGAGRQVEPRGPMTETKGQERPRSPLPAIVVVVDESPADLARLIRLTERGPDAGVHVVWVGGRVTALPAACRDYIDVETSTVGMVRQERMVLPIESEGLNLETAAFAARGLAPVADAGALDDDESDVPASVSMVNLIGQPMTDDPEQIIAHWQENGTLIDRSGPVRPRESKLALRALVGHTGLEAFTLDLRGQGPHALVGGTTGAGKSEFLQAWLLGLANAYSPDRLTFLLIDYKGGTAFAHCVKLPHCVGLVTDLSRHLVSRALQSLRAEIHHREILLNDKGAKDLIELETRGDPDCPPSLVIVVDEFAALKMEFPEFVDGMVDVAQRGRSLGLHLILATQRPAGVIGENIRANTNLRIALRMNDEHDSKDIIDDIMSAHIAPETPGRGVAKVGPGRLQTFQAGYPGARTSSEPEQAPVDLQKIRFGQRNSWKVPKQTARGPKVEKDIERIVGSILTACRIAGVPDPRRPWLQELSPVYDLLKLRQRRDDELVLGVLDDPDHQDQRVEYYRPDHDINLLIVGAGGSGKTTALRTLALASAITPRSGPVHVFGIDFTGRGLVSLEVMPNVGSIVPGADGERVARLLRTMDTLVTERGNRYAAVNASNLPEYRQLANEPDEPRILLLLDGYSAFQEEYFGNSRHHLFQIFQRLLTEGRAVGVHFVITADRPGAVNTTIGAAFPRKLALRLADDNAYLDLGIPRDALTASTSPGRAMTVPGNLELQLALVGGRAGVADQVREMDTLSKAMSPHHRSRPRPIRSLPTLVRLRDLTQRHTPVVGISDETLEVLPAPRAGLVMVTGPKGSGKSNAVAVWAQSLKDSTPGVELVHLGAKKTPISGLNLWTDAATGYADVRTLLNSLEARMRMGDRDGASVAVFCEGVASLSDEGLSGELASLVRKTQDTNNLFVGEGAADSWNSAYEVGPLLKGARRALVLQMGKDSAYSLIDQMLPSLARADLVPGRGFWVDQSGATKVQVPVHG